MKIKTALLAFSMLLNLVFKLQAQTLEWRELPGIPTGGRYNDLYFTDANTGWIIEYGKVHKTTTSGATWTHYVQSGSNRSVGFFDSNTGILGTLDTAKPLSRSTNGGVNWVAVTNLPDPKPRGVCGISIVDSSCAYFVGAYSRDGRAYKTTDKGLTWSIAFNDSSLARTLIDCYFWSRDSGFIAGGYNTSSFTEGNAVIVLTTDGGMHWQRVFRSDRTKEWCWKISFNKSYSEDFGVVSIERSWTNGFSYILKTTDRGFNWTEIPFMAYDQEGIGFVNENTGWVGGYGIYVPTNDSTYQTTNGGLTWEIAGWGKSLNRIRFINDTLAFGGGSNAYKYSREITGVPLISSEIPEEFILSQNYPNPFNPITVIKFDIPKSNDRKPAVYTKLKVYDALGRDIRTLINEDLSPGSYQVSFDGGYFPSGVYYYRLESGEYSMSKRMVILK